MLITYDLMLLVLDSTDYSIKIISYFSIKTLYKITLSTPTTNFWFALLSLLLCFRFCFCFASFFFEKQGGRRRRRMNKNNNNNNNKEKESQLESKKSVETILNLHHYFHTLLHKHQCQDAVWCHSE